MATSSQCILCFSFGAGSCPHPETAPSQRLHHGALAGSAGAAGPRIGPGSFGRLAHAPWPLSGVRSLIHRLVLPTIAVGPRIVPAAAGRCPVDAAIQEAGHHRLTPTLGWRLARGHRSVRPGEQDAGAGHRNRQPYRAPEPAAPPPEHRHMEHQRGHARAAMATRPTTTTTQRQIGRSCNHAITFGEGGSGTGGGSGGGCGPGDGSGACSAVEARSAACWARSASRSVAWRSISAWSAPGVC